MTAFLSTIVVVPRERFLLAPESLESVIAAAGTPHKLIYVDAGSPPRIARQLAEAAKRHNFTLLRTSRYLTPNQARNLALPLLDTEYVAFVDNDVFGAAGWLAALERCAEETGADIVAPLTCIGRPLHSRIHHAGGESRFLLRDGLRLFVERHNLNGTPLAAVRGELKREPTEMAEFHCVLTRRSVFARHGKLDEELMASHEHIDLCLTVMEGGGRIFFEPESVITYVPAPLALHELPFFMLRWSEEWSQRSIDRFMAKWKAADANPAAHNVRFVWEHRGFGMPNFRKHVMGLAGWRGGKWIVDGVERVLAGLARRRFPEIGTNIQLTQVHKAGAA